jgi:hypothetical protein
MSFIYIYISMIIWLGKDFEKLVRILTNYINFKINNHINF